MAINRTHLPLAGSEWRGPERDVLPRHRSNRHELERFWYRPAHPDGNLPAHPAGGLCQSGDAQPVIVETGMVPMGMAIDFGCPEV